MKRMKYWLLLLCFMLGLSGCGSQGMEMVLQEVVQSVILDEYLEPENVQKIEVPEGEMEVHFIDEKDDRIFLSLAVPDETVQYGIQERHWYDKNDPSIAYIQFVYYDKPWLLDDSTEQYWDWANQTDQSSDDAEHNIYIETGEQRYAQGDLNGFTSFIDPLAVQMSLIDRDMNLPVNKIIYQGEEDMVLWEK